MSTAPPSLDMHDRMLEDLDRAIDAMTLGATERAPRRPTASFRSILVGFDASAASERAVAWAQRLARGHDASIVVATVIPTPPPAFGTGFDTGAWTAMTESFYDWSEQLARRGHEMERELARAGFATTLIERTGSPTRELAHAASDVDADLVVLGARPGAHRGRVLLGTTAGGVAARVHASVLLARNLPTVSRILAATDGSAPSRRAVATALHYGKALDASVEVFHVVSEDGSPTAEAVKSRLVDDLLRRLPPAEIPSVTYNVDFGRPAEAIVERANASGADLIVLGARGMGRIAGLVLGSVAQQVATSAPQDVLIIKEN